LTLNKPKSKAGFAEHLRYVKAAQLSVTKIISPTFGHVVAPKVGAKHELLFNKLASAGGLR
jgi:hypothetical protein